MQHTIQHILDRKKILRTDRLIIEPWLKPCPVNVLIVTDGGLDFGLGDFGLSAFLDCLINDGRFYVNFRITLAHLRSNVSDQQMAGSNTSTAIVRRIKDFVFDDPNYFAQGMYDEVWLFGIETFYRNGNYNRRNTQVNGAFPYPTNSLSNNELNAIHQFMTNGGGVFATGDHGALGNGLCGAINRVKSMRYWNHYPTGNDATSEVGMTGTRRNDTNSAQFIMSDGTVQTSDAGTQFSDQSDDIPQRLELKLYHSRSGPFIRRSYPHPLMCSRLGRINVFPDHPHEGECREPLAAEYNQYPNLPSGNPLLPEVIAWSSVPAGNTGTLRNTSKAPTVAQRFGAICAFDGHIAGQGRIVTDATWHHFVNVNLIGLVEGGFFDDLTPANSLSKHDGFLSSPQGQQHFALIKEYFINIGVWIAPSSKIQCFNSRFLKRLLYSDRIMEAALSDPNTTFEKISLNLNYSIGVHARDVLGRLAGQCESIRFLYDIIVREFLPVLEPKINPWSKFAEPIKRFDSEVPLPVHDYEPILDIALGSLLVALRQEMPYYTEDKDKQFEESYKRVAAGKVMSNIAKAIEFYTKESNGFAETLNVALKNLKTGK